MINYNSSQYTLDCIDSIFAQTSSDLRFQVIVIDNASVPEEYARLRPLESREHVLVFRSRLNTGFSGANMMGVQLARADYYYFLNNDCILLEDCLKTLYDFMELHPDAGNCSGEMFNAAMEYEANFGYFPVLSLKLFGSGLLRLFRPGHFPSRHKRIVVPTRVDLVNGSSMFVRGTALEAIGGMDIHYFLYCEEEDLAWQLRRTGQLTYLVPGATYQHFVSRSTAKDNSINLVFLQEFYISFLYYYRKNHGFIYCAVIQLLYFFKILRKFYRHMDYVRLAFFILGGAPMKYSLRFSQKMAGE